MSRFRYFFALATVLAAGCAATPEQASDGRAAVPASAQGDAQASAQGDAQASAQGDAQASAQGDAQASAQGDAQASAQGGAQGGTEGAPSIQTIAVSQHDADPSAVIVCRDMLQPASNVIVTRCMTRAGWDIFERAQTRQAQQFLRRLQGNPFP